MISRPKNGWCNFNIDGFNASPSYLTDVPMDLLDAFVDFFCDRKFSGCVNLDEEGSEFYLVLTANGAYIIEEKDKAKLIVLESSVRDLAEEVMDDISSNLTGWAKEFCVDIGLGNNKNKDKEIMDERIRMFKSKIQLLQDVFDSYDKNKEKVEEETRQRIDELNKCDKNMFIVIEGGKKTEEEENK